MVRLFTQVRVGRYVIEGPRWELISAPAKDLIGKMLVKKPSNRITAEAALGHPWLAEIDQHVSTQKLDPSVSGAVGPHCRN
jgi:serine/threonine protein kinase